MLSVDINFCVFLLTLEVFPVFNLWTLSLLLNRERGLCLTGCHPSQYEFPLGSLGVDLYRLVEMC